MGRPKYSRFACAVALAVVSVLSFGAEAASGARPRTAQCPQTGTHAVSLAKLSDGGFLTEDGLEIRLAGILALDKPKSLEAVLNSGPLTLGPNSSMDRYGRTLANVFAGGVWVQGALIRDGEVRAYPEIGNRDCAKALFDAENEARAAEAGHWGDGRFEILAPQRLRNQNGRFAIVEGEVVSASVTRGRAYINFGPDYRTDFTVTVSPDDMKSFRAAKFDVPGLAGKRVRVRGWIGSFNGPEMEIATPSSIEILTRD